MSKTPLNEAIRDVLAEYEKDDTPASNRQAAEEVLTRYPDAVDERAKELVLCEIINRIRSLRKKPSAASGRSASQLSLPGMAKDLLPRLPAEIPRYPAAKIEVDQDEIPWGNLWTSTIGEVRRYANRLQEGIRADTARHNAIRELLDMASNGGGVSDEARIIDAVHKREAAE